MDKLKKILFEIKDNLGIITIIPIVFGGVWQILSLASISISYIRFFSVTQLISDGLLILLILLILFLAIRFGILIISDFNKNIDIDNSYLWHSYHIFMTFLILVFFTYYSIDIAKELLQKNEFGVAVMVALIFILFLFFAIILRFLLGITAALIKINLIKVEKISDLKISESFSIIFVVVFLIFIFFTGKAIIQFHNAYYSPKNLVNTQRLLSKYCSDRKILSKSSVKIQYFNDKYIFIQKNNDIEVLKFDDFFFQQVK